MGRPQPPRPPPPPPPPPLPRRCRRRRRRRYNLLTAAAGPRVQERGASLSGSRPAASGGGSVELMPPPPPPAKPEPKEANGSSNGSAVASSHGSRKSSGSRKVGKRQGGSSNKSGGRSGHGGRSEDGPATSDRDEHPWKVGSTLEVITWNRTDRKFCDIVETAPISAMTDDPDPAKRTKYYVHYHGLNRRMDEWVGADRVTKPPSVAKAQAKAQKEETERARKEFERDNSAEVDLGIRTRQQKRKIGDTEEEEVAGAGGLGGHGGQTMHMDDDHDEHHGLDEASLKEHEEVTKVKNVNGVELGRYRMECWYFSPFPKEFYPDGYVDTLYFCEYTLRYFRHKKELLRFQRKQKPPRHPPGNEIYRNGNLAMFEVDGGEQKEYGQNLCSLAKLFLDHKTLYYDVDPFLFYVLCEVDSFGFHPVGYFSKEKYSDLGYNLACILTFPSYQRKGYGRVLIAFSYELSKKEEKVGSPEKPLSDLGAAAYRSYWASVIIQAMQSFEGRELAIVDVSKATSVISEDVIDTMTRLGMLKYADGEHRIVATRVMLSTLATKYPIKEPRVDPNKVHWTPLVDSAHLGDKFFIRNKIPPSAETVDMEEEE
ncbi:similar histone aceytl-transferase HAC108 [Ectocarpus siliculosus]|uniref:Histone acetyltransferase n=1 Tax=Ectocarpus siliculosus TaxID=2880 RepID=D7G7K4_ECTSI|nr:similar histone aceytl-transferase HAC108 [Ectocarpus siliculosus]|eukprot:CBJ27743.1 similar histone aceytl-transferase HAC108 [Ectocarpus siliculosus]